MVSEHPIDLHVQNMLVDKIDTIRKAIDDAMPGEVNQGKPISHVSGGETEEEFQARMQRAAELEAAQDAVKGNRSKEIAKSKVAGIHERESKRMTHEILPLTPERSEQVRQAFNYMLGVCDGAFQRDGQGFNKPDAGVAHWLLSAGLETNEEVEAAYFIPEILFFTHFFLPPLFLYSW